MRGVRSLRIRDTLSGELRELEPREPGEVGIYACGPTTYGRIHIGNARPFVIFTLLRRFLAHEGLDAKLVINVTDINDKIYAAAAEEGVPSREWAERTGAGHGVALAEGFKVVTLIGDEDWAARSTGA